MRYNNFKPRVGAIVFLSIVVAALWLTAVYGTYEDSRREKYNVVVKPGEVTYGTHSSAVVPMTVTTTRPSSGVPMVSAGAVRSYAHSGHATMPTTSTTKGIYTTSSATVKTIGSGGATGGGMMTGSSSSANSQRGIVYGSPTISMPTLAMNNSRSSTVETQFAETATSQYRGSGRRKAKPLWDGDDGDVEADDEEDNKWWYWDGEDWTEVIPNVTVCIIDGVKKVFNGTEWVPYGGDWGEPGVPVGATPWLLMLALGAIYMTLKRIR